jgi:hypothetical protein
VIGQCRFSHVGATNNGDIASAKIGIAGVHGVDRVC